MNYRILMMYNVLRLLLSRKAKKTDPRWDAAGLEQPAQAILSQVSQAQELLAAVAPLTEEKLIFARRLMAKAGPRPKAAPPEVGRVEDVAIPVADADSITARLYYPVGPGPFPLHVFFHGGAFIFGAATDADTDSYMRVRCREAETAVLNVDYRLAPEHRFPVGVEDCYSALTWAVDHAEQLGINPSKVSVGGVSSGGNMAAAVALMARDRGGPVLLGQVLEIPGTDLTKNSTSWRDDSIKDTTREADLALIDFYLGKPEDITHPYASPLFAESLDGVAPAYVMSAEFDPRREESEAYVARLQEAGVEAVARTMKGHVHGSYALYDSWPPARAWQQEANAVIRRLNLQTPGSAFEGWESFVA
ncbi:MAG: alpha/beta hydrolase [Propionibacteriaceae bacterium]|nr:alpha/beta hydrolase [Propionibacteriaceae bacterium]